MVGDQSNASALQRRKALADDHVDARQYRRGRQIARHGGRVGGRKVGAREPGAALVARAVERRGDGCRRDLAAQRRHVSTPVRVHAVGEKDHIELRDGIDPHRRTGETGVSERANREELTTIRGKRRIDVPAKAAHGGHPCGSGRRDHLLDRRRRQDARAAERATVDQRAGKAREISRRAEEAGVTGDAAHAACRRVVHDSAQQRRLGRVARRARHPFASLGRCNSRELRRRRVEPGLCHTQRLEDFAPRVLVERLTAHARNDMPEEEEVDVAVDETLTGRRRRHFVHREGERRVVALPWIEIDVRPQSGNVRQQMPDRDGALAVALEARHEAGHGIVEPNPSLLYQPHHRRRRRNDFGQRRQVEDRVQRHPFRRGIDGAIAVCLFVQHLVAAADEHDCAGRLSCGDRFLDEAIDRGKA